MSPSKAKGKGVRGSRHAPPTNAFPKGHPGGPGRPKDDPEFVAACRDRTPKALAVLDKAMSDYLEPPPGAPPGRAADAIKAGEVLLNRGWGTAPSTVKLDVDAKVDTTVREMVAVKLDPQRLARIAGVLQRAGVLPDAESADGSTRASETTEPAP